MLPYRSGMAPLDARIAEIAREPGRTWGVREAVLGLLAVPAAFAVAVVLLSLVPGLPGALAAVFATAALGAAAVAVARRPARQSGGFAAALGLELPLWSDTGRILRWSLLLLVVQAVAVALLVSFVPALEGAEADNSSFLREEPMWALLLFVLLATAIAPVLEELLFRGIVLRGLMLRLGFWPAAIVSSVCFGLFHAPGLGGDAVLIVVATGVFGLGLCLLTRRTGRLGPGIGVHAVRNAVAISYVLLA
jgi:membrane protease YdiL (CAAX protease family)